MFCFFQIYSKQEQFLTEQSKWMLPAKSLWSFSKIETVNTFIALFDFLKTPTLIKKIYTQIYINGNQQDKEYLKNCIYFTE